MTPDTLAGWICQWLMPLSPEERLKILDAVIDNFCPSCGIENRETLNGKKRRCTCDDGTPFAS